MTAKKLPKGYGPLKYCAECGGNCCKSYAGCAWPQDLEPLTEKHLLKLFRSGAWAIDWYEGDPRPEDSYEEEDYLGSEAYVVRPAHTNEPGELLDPSWGGECVMLRSTGCALKHEDRPTQCRMLKPRKDESCTASTDWHKQQAAIAWIPYHDLLNKVIKTIQDERGE